MNRLRNSRTEIASLLFVGIALGGTACSVTTETPTAVAGPQLISINDAYKKFDLYDESLTYRDGGAILSISLPKLASHSQINPITGNPLLDKVNITCDYTTLLVHDTTTPASSYLAKFPNDPACINRTIDPSDAIIDRSDLIIPLGFLQAGITDTIYAVNN